MSSFKVNCYLCGEAANGSDDHVPPEVIFKGAMHSYKSPKIITVPSCLVHNEGASGDDEHLAWVMSDASFTTQTGLDVFQALLKPVSEKIYKDRNFADERLNRCGIYMRRDPKDFDD